MKLTKFQRKALITIRDNPGITAKYFAEIMWPNSFMHDKYSGNIVGKVAWLCAGSHLGKLRKKGWVEIINVFIYNTYELTKEGKEVLKIKDRWKKQIKWK
jgi:hypothetical protein